MPVCPQTTREVYQSHVLKIPRTKFHAVCYHHWLKSLFRRLVGFPFVSPHSCQPQGGRELSTPDDDPSSTRAGTAKTPHAVTAADEVSVKEVRLYMFWCDRSMHSYPAVSLCIIRITTRNPRVSLSRRTSDVCREANNTVPPLGAEQCRTLGTPASLPAARNTDGDARDATSMLSDVSCTFHSCILPLVVKFLRRLVSRSNRKRLRQQHSWVHGHGVCRRCHRTSCFYIVREGSLLFSGLPLFLYLCYPRGACASTPQRLFGH